MRYITNRDFERPVKQKKKNTIIKLLFKIIILTAMLMSEIYLVFLYIYRWKTQENTFEH